MTLEERLQRYTELAVRVGANVQPGQDVVIMCLVEHADIARAIAREASEQARVMSCPVTETSTSAARQSS